LYIKEKNLEKLPRTFRKYFNINKKCYFLLQCPFVSEISLKTRTFVSRLVRLILLSKCCILGKQRRHMCVESPKVG
jgi:hypothetical protein